MSFLFIEKTRHESGWSLFVFKRWFFTNLLYYVWCFSNYVLLVDLNTWGDSKTTEKHWPTCSLSAKYLILQFITYQREDCRLKQTKKASLFPRGTWPPAPTPHKFRLQNFHPCHLYEVDNFLKFKKMQSNLIKRFKSSTSCYLSY